MRFRFALVLLGAAMSAQDGPFAPAETCGLCHALPDSLAPYALWSGSMKAHAAADPYWKAKLLDEASLAPAARAAIEDKCLRCHAPARQYGFRGSSRPMRLGDLDQMGLDGVTCTVCHQIERAGLGGRGSFSGGFTIGLERLIWGPHQDPFPMPMLHHSGYMPDEGRHVLEAALCGTCHTVITPALDGTGRQSGEFLEQAPYLEWLASAYPAEGRTCQSCHMPLLGRPEYIAHRPGGGPFPPTSPREPFGRHLFVGGNAQVPRMMATANAAESGLLEGTARRAAANLASALRLETSAQFEEDRLVLQVEVHNLTGHKLPTAYPSRRLWLHVRVTGAGGRPVFETGAWDRQTGEIRAAGGVTVWEAEYRDGSGRPTTSLLRAAGYRKDNRILPRGFDARRGQVSGIRAGAIAPVGVSGDPDFLPGSDTVTYHMRVPREQCCRVEVEALYQSIKPSHAAGLAAGTPEGKAFAALYTAVPGPVSVARHEAVFRPGAPDPQR